MKVYLIQSETTFDNVGYYSKEAAQSALDIKNDKFAKLEEYRIIWEEIILDYDNLEDLTLEEFEEIVKTEYKYIDQSLIESIYDYFTSYTDWFETPFYEIIEIEII